MITELLEAIRNKARLHSNPKLLLLLGVLLVALFVINYSLDLEDSHIDAIEPFYLRSLSMFAFHGLPYLVACGIVALIGLQNTWFRSKGFWVSFVLGFGILAIDRSLDLKPWLLPILEATTDDAIQVWFKYRVATKFSGFFTVILPLVAVYAIGSRFSTPADRIPASTAFGLQFSGFKVRPYIAVLAIAGILVCIGGLFADLQAFYPRYARSGGEVFAASRQIPEWIAVLIYELAYGFDFLATEFFFRGFLVLVMMRYLGPHALIPMAVTYAVLHFGKPMTEAISSIFGGYILGVLAMHHKNIWGGVMIHVGMAWMMELVGFMYK